MSAAGLPDPQASPKRALQGVLALAVSDDLIKKSQARADTVTKPRAGIGPKVIAWGDDRVEAVYGHMQQGRDEHARSIIDARMNRPRKVSGGGPLRLVKPGEQPPGA